MQHSDTATMQYLCQYITLLFYILIVAIDTRKKQVGCFNHRVVALVAIMSGLCEVSFGIRDLIALGNQRGSCSGHLTTTILLIVTTTM